MVDWQRAKHRLEESQMALDRALVVDEARMQEEFRRRAELLAARRLDGGKRVATIPTLVFALGTETYGLSLQAMSEVFPFGKCTPVPAGPPELLGVINVRGEIRSVVDLVRLIGLAPAEERPPGYIVLMRRGDTEVGLRVDRVEKIELVDPKTLTDLNEGAAGVSSAFLQGRTPSHVMLLRTDALLSHSLFAEAPRAPGR